MWHGEVPSDSDSEEKNHDHLAGRWRIFSNSLIENAGFSAPATDFVTPKHGTQRWGEGYHGYNKVDDVEWTVDFLDVGQPTTKTVEIELASDTDEVDQSE